MHLVFDAALSKFHQNCKEMIVSRDFGGTASTSVMVNNISFCVHFRVVSWPPMQSKLFFQKKFIFSQLQDQTKTF